ncbi:alpha/beta hydrolase [Amycolatopsis australiensis]|uniref:Alpha/beta hydrolase family protein n=1 Tax=Amycolatopsis australiensis TaxID=546364 RepID=A0A1K1T3M7_9PSEU|nr:alpha/beta hydrolase [Amycolatopsis australiensis]SFW90661.1 Alpha/beta hydrolase family protein [Amycolatopsis australiensis]
MDFVLVHGTTQGPDGWAPLERELTGHRTHPVDLLDGDGPDYPALVRRQVPELRRPVVVAHSGAGVLLPAIGEALGASRLVWVGAYIPDFAGGRSLAEEVAAGATELFHREWIGVDPTRDPALADRFLFHDCDERTRAWAHGTLRLFAAPELLTRPAGPAPSIPSTVVVPTADRTLRPGWMARAARERLGLEPLGIDAGHCPHVSRPAELARLIVGGRPG